MALIVVDTDSLERAGNALTSLGNTFEQEITAVQTIPDVSSPEIAESHMFAGAAENSMKLLFTSGQAFARVVFMAGNLAYNTAIVYRAVDGESAGAFSGTPAASTGAGAAASGGQIIGSGAIGSSDPGAGTGSGPAGAGTTGTGTTGAGTSTGGAGPAGPAGSGTGGPFNAADVNVTSGTTVSVQGGSAQDAQQAFARNIQSGGTLA